ncbi:MAG: DNA-deoxyinosine glycosylase [Lachnospiraceae bacterium]|nr:DNA-deoxyinosine glycosylase [Lachnospiraceae bacterium]
MKKSKLQCEHNIEPVYNAGSRVLILGSFPSVKSREAEFFYSHPKNRFWKVLPALFEEEEPVTTEDKKTFLLSHGIALWDVIASCEIAGSSDSSIQNVELNDISRILKAADIKAIYANGTKAATLYEKYIRPVTGREIMKLPSTSPANASWSLERLIQEWKCVRLHLD